jgi:hypothetical protein
MNIRLSPDAPLDVAPTLARYGDWGEVRRLLFLDADLFGFYRMAESEGILLLAGFGRLKASAGGGT